MQGAVILHVAVFADGDMVKVAADHSAIPYAAAIRQGDITKDGSAFGNESGSFNIRFFISQLLYHRYDLRSWGNR